MTPRSAAPLAVPVIAGIGASGLFLLFHYVLVLPGAGSLVGFVLALGLAAAAYAGLVLLLPRPKSLAEELADLALEGGVTPEELAEALTDNSRRIAAIRQANEDISGDVHDRIARIADKAEAIVEGFREDPGDIRRSGNFLHHYLEATAEIVCQYRDLTGKAAGERVRGVLDKAEGTLTEIEDVFDRQYERNLDNEALRLDVDLDVLRRMIKSEGL